MTHSKVDKFNAQLARILIGGFFIYSGTDNYLDIFATASEIDLPAAILLVAVGGAIKIILGFCIITRFHTKYSSFLLVLYMTFASFFFYGPHLWLEHELYEYIFMRNLAIIGGLLFLHAHSRGYSLWQEDWFIGRNNKLLKKNLYHEIPHP